jgi:hypothetical protein
VREEERGEKKMRGEEGERREGERRERREEKGRGEEEERRGG